MSFVRFKRNKWVLILFHRRLCVFVCLLVIGAAYLSFCQHIFLFFCTISRLQSIVGVKSSFISFDEFEQITENKKKNSPCGRKKKRRNVFDVGGVAHRLTNEHCEYLSDKDKARFWIHHGVPRISILCMPFSCSVMRRSSSSIST